MPYISFKNVDKQTVKEISANNNTIAKIIDCPEDWVIYEYIESQFYHHSEILENTIIIEIKWFEREQNVKEKLTDYLFEVLKKKYPQKEITIYFLPLEKKNFFEIE